MDLPKTTRNIERKAAAAPLLVASELLIDLGSKN